MIALSILRSILSFAIALLLLLAPIIALTAGVQLWRMRARHRVFLHMAILKFGMAIGLLALIISDIDPTKRGISIRLTGWHGAWFVTGLCAIAIPLGALAAFLLGLKNGHSLQKL